MYINSPEGPFRTDCACDRCVFMRGHIEQALDRTKCLKCGSKQFLLTNFLNCTLCLLCCRYAFDEDVAKEMVVALPGWDARELVVPLYTGDLYDFNKSSVERWHIVDGNIKAHGDNIKVYKSAMIQDDSCASNVEYDESFFVGVGKINILAYINKIYVECDSCIINERHILSSDSIIGYQDFDVCCICRQAGGRRTKIGKYTVHPDCVSRDLHSSENIRIIGNLVKLPSFSFEFETEDVYMNDYEEKVIDLMTEGFIRASDGTVDDELKSPIYNSDKDLFKIAPKLESLKPCVTKACGTHIHIGTNRYVKAFIQENIGIFNPLTEYMDNDDKTSRIWGRRFNPYALSQYDGTRYYWLNTHSGYPTLEYRLAKYTSFTQYRRLIAFSRVFTKSLAKDYQKFDNEDKLIGNLLKRQYRAKFADKLVSDYEKFWRNL